MRIVIIGAGSFGTALATVWAKSEKGEIFLLSRRKEVVEEINLRHRNPCLPGVKVGGKAALFSDFVFLSDDLVVLAVPSYFLRGILEEFKLKFQNQILLGTSKGIEWDTLLFPYQLVKEVLGEVRYFHISGPAFAREIAQGKRTTNLLAGLKFEPAKELAEFLAFKSNLALIPSDDLIGATFAGPAKNAIALAMGLYDFQRPAEVSRATYFIELLWEVVEMGRLLGARAETFWGPAGLGDAFLSVSPQSRSYQAGFSRFLHRFAPQWLRRRFKTPISLKDGKIIFDLSVFLKDLEYFFNLDSLNLFDSQEENERVNEGIISLFTLYRLSQKLGLRLPRLQETFFAYFEGSELAEEKIKKLLKK